MIIFINGSINAGKSTIAKMLASKIPNTANVEIDIFYKFIHWLEIDKAVSINLKNAVLVINNFAKHGYNVVVPYPLSQNNYEYLKKELDDNELYFFTLSPDIKKAQNDTSDRKLTEWDRDHIQYHYNIGISKPDFGKIIDNTNQTPEETTEEIISLIPKNFFNNDNKE